MILHESTGVRYINKSQLDVLLKNTLSTLIKRLVRDEEKLLFKSVHSLSKHNDRNTPTKAHSIIETEMNFITYFTQEINYKSIQLNYALTTGSFLTYQMKDFYHKSSIILDNRILLLLTKMLKNYTNELCESQLHRVEMDVPRILAIGLMLYSNVLLNQTISNSRHIVSDDISKPNYNSIMILVYCYFSLAAYLMLDYPLLYQLHLWRNSIYYVLYYLFV